MKYRVRNWDEYQHYRDRNPPWIKLHFSLLSSADWVALDDASRTLAVAIMLVASRNNGEIDGSAGGLAYLKRVAYLNSSPKLKPLIDCGFLIALADASTMIADAIPETETETETDTPTQSVGAHLIPLDWMPNESVAELSKRHHVSESDVLTVIEEFREYWTASGRRQKNWQLVWVKNPVAKGRFHSIAKRNKGNGSAPADYGRGGI